MPPQEKMLEQSQSMGGEDSLSNDHAAKHSSADNSDDLGGRKTPLGAEDEGKITAKEREVKYENTSENITINDMSSETRAENENDSKILDFDDVLPLLGGQFGRYQKILFMLLAPFACFVAFVYFTQIFITLVPEDHYCYVPELKNLTPSERKNLSIPRREDGTFDRCMMYDVDYKYLLENGYVVNSSAPQVPCRYGWEFIYSDVPYPTIATELQWVCDRAAYPTYATSIFFCGAILGGLLFGFIADHYGRIPSLVGTNVIGLIAGVGTAFANDFWTFCFCRFVLGFAFDNCFTMMYILVLEYVGPTWRTFVANMSIAIYFTLASCALPWIAYFLADWRMLCVVTSVPLALAFITPWIVPESARWLVSQGRTEEAIKIMRRFEKVNGVKVDPNVYVNFRDSCQKIQKEEEANKTYSVLDLFKTPHLRNMTLLLIIIWMAISLCFDGHVRNVGSLGLDVFLTFTIASATELPADTMLTLVLDRWGRRWLACGSMVLGGVFSLLASAVPTGVASALLAIMGRFAVNISYNIGLQYAAELLPTVVRAQGVALIHIMGYVANILSPFVVYLSNISQVLPLVILGILGLLGGVLSLFLPETLNQELPQTLQDGENFGKTQAFFDFPCQKKVLKESKSTQVTPKLQRGYSGRASIRGETYRSSMLHRSTRRKHVA